MSLTFLQNFTFDACLTCGYTCALFTHSIKHKAHSAALLTPYLPPGAPLALFIKARPLKRWPVWPFLLWCRLPTSWVHSIPSFLPPLHQPLDSHSSGIFPLLLPFSPPWHIAFLSLHCECTALTVPNPPASSTHPTTLWIKLCRSDKNNKINQATALPFIFTLLTLSSVPPAGPVAASLIRTLFHVLPFFIWLPIEVISRVYGWEVQRRKTFMSLSPGIRVSSGKSNKAPRTHRLLLVDPGIKPSSCLAHKPEKAHISCVHRPHIQLPFRLQWQHQDMAASLVRVHNMSTCVTYFIHFKLP